METSEECLQQANQCEKQAAEAKLESSRKALLSAATMWRYLAEYPDAAEAIGRHPIVGFTRASTAGKKLIRH
jgi:hypothetical protein